MIGWGIKDTAGTTRTFGKFVRSVLSNCQIGAMGSPHRVNETSWLLKHCHHVFLQETIRGRWSAGERLFPTFTQT